MPERAHPRPARVLQVVLSLNPGGTERLVLDLATRLHPEIPTAVCCIDEAGSWAAEATRAGIDVHAIRRGPGFRPDVGRAIAAAARRHGATVIHAHHYSPFVYSSIARFFGAAVPVIYTEHGRVSDTPPSRKRYWANRLFFARRAARVFAVSAELGRHIEAEGFSAGQVGVIPNGIPLPAGPSAELRSRFRQEIGVGDGDLVVGTIGRLDPVKDFGTLIAAAGLVRQSGPVTVVIVGEGRDRAELERRADELNMRAHVRLVGHRNDAREWLNAYDVFVNSSVSEGVSLTILEAMAAGLPVVATEVGGTPEVVTAETGVLVPPRNPAALAGALEALCRDVPMRQALGRAGRARVEARFTLARMIDEYRNVYLAVA